MKKKGLPGSVLLKRTQEQPPKATLKLHEPESPTPTPTEAKPKREKVTVYLSAETQQRLALLAHMERRQRSAIVDDILRQHLPTMSELAGLLCKTG